MNYEESIEAKIETAFVTFGLGLFIVGGVGSLAAIALLWAGF